MKNELKTPQWINSLIDNLAPQHLAEEIRGDLYEIYLKDVTQQGEAAARTRYVFNGLGFLARSFFWRRSDQKHSSIMLGSYFKMARRTLSAHKSTAIINMAGLIIGIASTLVILTVNFSAGNGTDHFKQIIFAVFYFRL